MDSELKIQKNRDHFIAVGPDFHGFDTGHNPQQAYAGISIQAEAVIQQYSQHTAQGQDQAQDFAGHGAVKSYHS